MVTLRRDVAAAGNNKIFDRKNRDSEVLTDYDLFMEKKKQQRYLCDYKPVAPDQNKAPNFFGNNSASDKDDFSNIFNKATVKETKVSQTENNDAEYKRYLLEQLNRKEPAELLDKDSFYKRSSVAKTPAYANALAVPASKSSKKLSKNGKIFIAVYVLVVALVASIILAVNSASVPQRVDASATSGDAQGVISPMDVPAEGEIESTNRFDKLLDGLSNG